MALYAWYFYSVVLLKPSGSFVMITRVICLISPEDVLALILPTFVAAEARVLNTPSVCLPISAEA